ncbi:YbeD family protein [Frateuria aurantia]
MSNPPSSNETTEERGFSFPGIFEITAMGDASVDLKARVPQILADIGLKVLHETVSHRQSREGNFLSVTISFHCDNREQYDEAHRALRADPAIRFTL